MPFDWRDYLSLAQELSQRQDKAALRSAISRAYYAAFCSARNYLRQQGAAIPPTEASHKVVWEMYQQKGKTHAAIYQSGNRLKTRRRQADYEDQVGNLATEATAALNDARNVFYWLAKAAAQEAAD